MTMPPDSRQPRRSDNHFEVVRQMFASRTSLRPSDVALRARDRRRWRWRTGYIHSTLGGLLFTLNAIGYLTAAVAMVIPLALAVRFRWVVRLGLIGYAATTIVGWAIQGPYYTTAYIAKAIEVALIVARQPSTSPARTATRSTSSAASSPPSARSSPIAAAPRPPAPSPPPRPDKESTDMSA